MLGDLSQRFPGKKKNSTDGKLFYTMPPKIYWYYRLAKNSTPKVKANQRQTSTINLSCLVWMSSCTLPVWWKVFAPKTNRAPDHLTEQFLPCHLKHTNGAAKFKTKANTQRENCSDQSEKKGKQQNPKFKHTNPGFHYIGLPIELQESWVVIELGLAIGRHSLQLGKFTLYKAKTGRRCSKLTKSQQLVASLQGPCFKLGKWRSSTSLARVF